MKKSMIFIFVCILLAACSNKSISSVVSFGDSYADDGKCYTLWQESVTKGETNSEEMKDWDGNWENRLTNGPLAVEVLAQNLKVDLKNYAVCAAMTGKGNINFDMSALDNTGLLDQIGKFEADLNGKKADPKALYLITSGSSDVYASIFANQVEQFQNISPDQVSADITTAITRLSELGAKQVMVWNTADQLPKLPMSVSAGVVDQAVQFKDQLDAQLPAQLADLAKQLGITISLFDYNALDAQIRSDPAKYGLKNVTDMCKTSATDPICTAPDEYLYWDGVSLSAHANQIVSEAMAKQLGK